jgi:two-component system NarL family response regulator
VVVVITKESTVLDDQFTNQIRVLCVDDHRLVRQGIALIIDREPDMTVVASAASGADAVALFKQYLPDVTLMDLKLGRMSGLEAIRAIRRYCEAAQIVVLTMYDGDEDVYRALEAGAATYLLKDMLSDDLINIIREVSAGRRPLAAGIQARLAERSTYVPLTPREIEVLDRVKLGLRNKEIAASLHISEKTVQVHIKNLLLKLKVNDRTAAVNVALRRGIIHL